MKTYTEHTEFDSDFGWLNHFLNKNFTKNVSQLLSENKITASVNHLDPSNEEWDGEIHIDVSKLSTQIIVNKLIGISHADEISMPDSKNLRLWWD